MSQALEALAIANETREKQAEWRQRVGKAAMWDGVLLLIEALRDDPQGVHSAQTVFRFLTTPRSFGPTKAERLIQSAHMNPARAFVPVRNLTPGERGRLDHGVAKAGRMTPSTPEKQRTLTKQRERRFAGERPKRCRCERPAIHSSLDGHTSCLLCGKEPRS